jgi:hypothetical protein
LNAYDLNQLEIEPICQLFVDERFARTPSARMKFGIRWRVLLKELLEELRDVEGGRFGAIEIIPIHMQTLFAGTERRP